MEERVGEGRTVELGELRIKLDQMTGRICSRLKDRSRFPRNETVYKPDGVKIVGRSGISFLEFAIEGLENYHASLGRFNYPDQFPVLGLNLPDSAAERKVGKIQLPKVLVNLSGDLISFYRGLVLKYCDEGDDPETYGETVFIDADIIQLMHERINIGRQVAVAKGNLDSSIYGLESEEEILAKLRDKDREEALLDLVARTTERYQFSNDMAQEAFRWMIERTIEVELALIRQAPLNKL